MTLAARNIDTPHQKRSSEHGVMNVVTLPGATIVRAEFQPGWRWSADVGPAAGTDSCQVPHTGIILSGRFAIRMDDGTQGEYGPGDAHVVGPGHDAWVVGDEPCVIIDVASTAAPGTRMASCPCGVEFRAPADRVEHLVAAVQQHAKGSHGHDVSREHVLSDLVTA
jgi:predicted small metal-binding protein